MSAVIFPNSQKTENTFPYHFKPSNLPSYYTIYQDFQPLSCSLNSRLTNAQSDTFQVGEKKKEMLHQSELLW